MIETFGMASLVAANVTMAHTWAGPHRVMESTPIFDALVADFAARVTDSADREKP